MTRHEQIKDFRKQTREASQAVVDYTANLTDEQRQRLVRGPAKGDSVVVYEVYQLPKTDPQSPDIYVRLYEELAFAGRDWLVCEQITLRVSGAFRTRAIVETYPASDREKWTAVDDPERVWAKALREAAKADAAEAAEQQAKADAEQYGIRVRVYRDMHDKEGFEAFAVAATRTQIKTLGAYTFTRAKGRAIGQYGDFVGRPRLASDSLAKVLEAIGQRDRVDIVAERKAAMQTQAEKHDGQG